MSSSIRQKQTSAIQKEKSIYASACEPIRQNRLHSLSYIYTKSPLPCWNSAHFNSPKTFMVSPKHANPLSSALRIESDFNSPKTLMNSPKIISTCGNDPKKAANCPSVIYVSEKLGHGLPILRIGRLGAITPTCSIPIALLP